MMRSASAASNRAPVSTRPCPSRSSRNAPSGFTMISMTSGSASAAAICGPIAVRSMAWRRLCAVELTEPLIPRLAGLRERLRACGHLAADLLDEPVEAVAADRARGSIGFGKLSCQAIMLVDEQREAFQEHLNITA